MQLFPTPQTKYLVEVKTAHEKTTYYFKHLTGPNSAEQFFFSQCKENGIVPDDEFKDGIGDTTIWAREKCPGITIDFEKLTRLDLSIIFNLS